MENLIKTIFEEVSITDAYMNSPEETEARKVQHRTDAELENLLEDKYLEADSLITEQLSAYEMSAFAMGFKTAMNLMHQCSFSIPKAAVK